MAKDMIPKIFLAFGLFILPLWSLLIGVGLSNQGLKHGHVIVVVSIVCLVLSILLIFHWGTKWIRLAANEERPRLSAAGGIPGREDPTFYADWWKRGEDGYASFLASNRGLFEQLER